MRSRSYLGSSFKVWTNERTWLWSIVNQRHRGGMIGIASSKIEAIQEARFSIAELSAQGLSAAQESCAARKSSIAAVSSKSSMKGAEQRSSSRCSANA